jgi:hypothetical protein
MSRCLKRLGESYFRTPRTTITAFINLLAVLEQNPGSDWHQLLGDMEVAPDRGGEVESDVGMQAQGDDELTSFKL